MLKYTKKLITFPLKNQYKPNSIGSIHSLTHFQKSLFLLYMYKTVRLNIYTYRTISTNTHLKKSLHRIQKSLNSPMYHLHSSSLSKESTLKYTKNTIILITFPLKNLYKTNSFRSINLYKTNSFGSITQYKINSFGSINLLYIYITVRLNIYIYKTITTNIYLKKSLHRLLKPLNLPMYHLLNTTLHARFSPSTPNSTMYHLLHTSFLLSI